MSWVAAIGNNQGRLRQKLGRAHVSEISTHPQIRTVNSAVFLFHLIYIPAPMPCYVKQWTAALRRPESHACTHIVLQLVYTLGSGTRDKISVEVFDQKPENATAVASLKTGNCSRIFQLFPKSHDNTPIIRRQS